MISKRNFVNKKTTHSYSFVHNVYTSDKKSNKLDKQRSINKYQGQSLLISASYLSRDSSRQKNIFRFRRKSHFNFFFFFNIYFDILDMRIQRYFNSKLLVTIRTSIWFHFSMYSLSMLFQIKFSIKQFIAYFTLVIFYIFMNISDMAIHFLICYK